MKKKGGKVSPKKIYWDEKVIEFKTDISQKGKGKPGIGWVVGERVLRHLVFV